MTSMPLRARASGVAPVVLVVMWSSGFVGAELGARAHAMPLTLLGWRFTALAALLVSVALVTRTPWPTRRAWLRQGILALLCQVAYLLLIFEGVSHGVPGGTASLIAALQPLLVATVAGRVLGERITARMWAGMALGLVGVGLVVGGNLGGDLGGTETSPWFYLLPVVGMLSLGSGTVLERRWKPDDTLLQAVMIQAVVSAVVLIGLALIAGQATPPATLGFWRAVLWLIFLSSICGYGTYVFVARTRGATIVSTLLYLTPPTTMLWTFLMFGDPVTAAGLVGLAISAAGVLLVLRGRRTAQQADALKGAPNRSWVKT